MKRLLGTVLGVGSVAAIAWMMVVGSQMIRQPNPPKVSVVVSPSPAVNCNVEIPPMSCFAPGAGEAGPVPSPTSPACVYTDPNRCQPPCDPAQWPGQCINPDGGIATVSSPGPAAGGGGQSAGSVAPAGQIEAGATTFVIPRGSNGTGGKIGVMVTVLSGGAYAVGASVSGTCSGPGVSLNFSGTTASRSAWTPTVDPSIPSGPSAFFWVVMSGGFQEGAQYFCHGTASFSGMTASF